MEHMSNIITAIYFLIAGAVLNHDTFGAITIRDILIGLFWLPVLVIQAFVQLNIWAQKKLKTYDLVYNYTKYVLLHRWNKVSAHGVKYLSGTNIAHRSKLHKKLVDKIISLNTTIKAK